VNDWLEVTFEHRRAPANEKNPPALSCLEGLGERGRAKPTASCGPGVQSILKHYSDEASFKKYLSTSRQGSQKQRAVPDRNPLGDVVASNAKYSEVPSQDFLESSSQGGLPSPTASTVAAEAIGNRSGSIFQTEPELDEMLPPSAATSPSQARSATPTQHVSRSSSVPALPRLEDASHAGGQDGRASRSLWSGTGGAGEEAAPDISLDQSGRPQHSRSAASLQSSAGRTRGTTSPTQLAARDRKRYVVKKFTKLVSGKSVLVLTDKVDVRRAICGALADAQGVLCFLKTSRELLQCLSDRKGQHDAVILDLTKEELRVDAVLNIVRQHERYGGLPIVVIAGEREELSELVRSSCNFVVFMPIAASMLREALLWCFDRRTLQGLFQQEATTSSMENDSQMVVRATA